MTKQARANEIFASCQQKGGYTRKGIMFIIEESLGVSQAYASTLYNNARKANGNVGQNAALKKYIDDANAWGKIFPNHTMIEYPTTRQDCKPLFEKLACDLSPENLCCDGELPGHEVRRKHRFLMEVWSALETIFGRKVDEGETYRW